MWRELSLSKEGVVEADFVVVSQRRVGRVHAEPGRRPESG